MRNNVDRLWGFAILFMTGWNFALPVTSEAMPIWLTPVQLIYGIFTHDLLLFSYLGFLVVTRDGRLPIRQRDTRNIIFRLIVGLGCLGILSNAANFQPLREMGEAGRLFLLAVYFLLAVNWAERHGPTFVLRYLLLGIVSAGAINLYYTFTVSFTILQGLPFLLGQNGPGSILGLSVILSAWLMLERKAPLDAAIALASCVIGVFAASISYSKISLLMAGSGLIVWGVVLWRIFTDRRSRRLNAVILAILFVIAFVNQERISQYVQGVNAFIHYKFSTELMENKSVINRSQYFITVVEIMLRNPLLGVGSGGFYDAARATESYKSDRSVEEDPEAGESGTANPHNSFLYYASANGLVGLLLTVLLLMMSLRAFWRTLSSRGVPGRILWVCLVFAYFIYGMTLPTLFDTAFLYLPTAVAISLARSRPSTIQHSPVPI